MTSQSLPLERARPDVERNARFARGLETLMAADPGRPARLLASISDIAPDFAAFVVEYAYGDIGSRPGLDPRDRAFAELAAMLAISAPPAQIKDRLSSALAQGWSAGELVELIMQVSVVAGFPTAFHGLGLLKEILPPAPAADPL